MVTTDDLPGFIPQGFQRNLEVMQTAIRTRQTGLESHQFAPGGRPDGLPHSAEAAMVKWMGPKTSFDVIHQCLLTFGHYGWSMDLPHQQRMRDVMGLEIGDGTAGIMKLIIARERIGRVAVQYAKQGANR